MNDPEEVKAWKKVADGDYYPDEVDPEFVERVENGFYEWDEGIAP